nr:MAG TPA: hypothetical protein [Caudoviricetes sp.]
MIFNTLFNTLSVPAFPHSVYDDARHTIKIALIRE